MAINTNVIETIGLAIQYADEAYAIYNRLKGELAETDAAQHPTTLVEARDKLRDALARADKAAASLDAAITEQLGDS